MIQCLLKSLYSEKLNELFKILKIDIDDIIQDDNTYSIWVRYDTGAYTQDIYGKELKEKLKDKKTQQNIGSQ
jgi:hypothetical protein